MLSPHAQTAKYALRSSEFISSGPPQCLEQSVHWFRSPEQRQGSSCSGPGAHSDMETPLGKESIPSLRRRESIRSQIASGAIDHITHHSGERSPRHSQSAPSPRRASMTNPNLGHLAQTSDSSSNPAAAGTIDSHTHHSGERTLRNSRTTMSPKRASMTIPCMGHLAQTRDSSSSPVATGAIDHVTHHSGERSLRNSRTLSPRRTSLTIPNVALLAQIRDSSNSPVAAGAIDRITHHSGERSSHNSRTLSPRRTSTTIPNGGQFAPTPDSSSSLRATGAVDHSTYHSGERSLRNSRTSLSPRRASMAMLSKGPLAQKGDSSSSPDLRGSARRKSMANVVDRTSAETSDELTQAPHYRRKSTRNLTPESVVDGITRDSTNNPAEREDRSSSASRRKSVRNLPVQVNAAKSSTKSFKKTSASPASRPASMTTSISSTVEKLGDLTDPSPLTGRILAKVASPCPDDDLAPTLQRKSAPANAPYGRIPQLWITDTYLAFPSKIISPSKWQFLQKDKSFRKRNLSSSKQSNSSSQQASPTASPTALDDSHRSSGSPSKFSTLKSMLIQSNEDTPVNPRETNRFLKVLPDLLNGDSSSDDEPSQHSLARGSARTARTSNRRPASNGGTSPDPDFSEPVSDASDSDDSEPASVSNSGRIANPSGCVKRRVNPLSTTGFSSSPRARLGTHRSIVRAPGPVQNRPRSRSAGPRRTPGGAVPSVALQQFLSNEQQELGLEQEIIDD
jgi:hypothetical protein